MTTPADEAVPLQARARASRWRVLVTVLGTLAVIGAEFLLLDGVYTRATPIADQRVVVAQLVGEAAAA
ncbi:MAG: hypothetical protein JWQ53_2760, partial [Klenkia sp.]|nr:hypothetical protein [Klenkia sp.]